VACRGLTIGSDQRTHLPRHRRGKPIAKQHGAPITWRCRGNAASSTSVDHCGSRSPTSGRRAIGKICNRQIRLLGEHSIGGVAPRWSQARRASAPASAGRRCCSATAFMRGLYQPRAAVGVTARARG
jgi:hypothetical protein